MVLLSIHLINLNFIFYSLYYLRWGTFIGLVMLVTVTVFKNQSELQNATEITFGTLYPTNHRKHFFIL